MPRYILWFLALLWIGLAFYLKEEKKWASLLYTPPEIRVEVVGLVQKPGVYRLESGSSIRDVLKEAVPLPESQGILQGWNLDELLIDGQLVRVEAKH